MNLNPIHYPSPAKNIKCSFLDYVQLLMISQAGRWTQTPSATSLQPKNWNAHFWITFNFSGQLLWPKRWNGHFWITFNFWWSARLVDGLEPHLLPLSSQKMKCPFFNYVELLIISLAVQWTWTPSATPLQPKKWNAHFWITFNFWCCLGWLMDSNLIHNCSQARKMKRSFWITFNFWWLAGLVDGLKSHLPPLFTQKIKMLICELRSTSDNQPGWSIDLNPICYPSPAIKLECSFLDYVHFWWLARLVNELEPHPLPLSSQKMKCSFLDYIQLLMVGWAGRWTWTPSATPLQPK